MPKGILETPEAIDRLTFAQIKVFMQNQVVRLSIAPEDLAGYYDTASGIRINGYEVAEAPSLGIRGFTDAWEFLLENGFTWIGQPIPTVDSNGNQLVFIFQK